jgi:hypothetical protein
MYLKLKKNVFLPKLLKFVKNPKKEPICEVLLIIALIVA